MSSHPNYIILIEISFSSLWNLGRLRAISRPSFWQSRRRRPSRKRDGRDIRLDSCYDVVLPHTGSQIDEKISCHQLHWTKPDVISLSPPCTLIHSVDRSNETSDFECTVIWIVSPCTRQSPLSPNMILENCCWKSEIMFHKNANDNTIDVMAIPYFLFLGKWIS